MDQKAADYRPILFRKMWPLSHAKKGVPFKNGGLMEKNVVHSDPEIMGGTPVFMGTRVPVSYLFDYLEAGDSIEVFLDDYPTVSKDVAIAALKAASKLITRDAYIAR
jgi:uncharacterized protein (DUF433 family)